MREFVTMRFWMTLVALLALTGLVYVATRSAPRSDQVIAASATPTERHVDFIAPLGEFNGDADFAMQHGRTTGHLQLVIDGTRTMTVQPDTPGEISCTALTTAGQCAVAADLLGDAVLWFSVIPAGTSTTITLPGIIQLRDDNVVELSNGWVLNRSAVVETDCTDDVGSLTEFVRRFGASSTSTFTYASQQITAATCTQSPETTTTTIPGTGPTVPGAPGDTAVVDTAPSASDSGVG